MSANLYHPQPLLTKEGSLLEKIKKIKYLLLDVDGVLTNGAIFINENGEESLGFSIYDGMGIALFKKAGFDVGFVSGRKSMAIAKRASALGVSDCYLGASDKGAIYNEILIKHGLKECEVAFVGDDLIDLPVLRRVGLSVAVPNAVDAVLKEVDWVTARKGGEGAIRELIDAILSASEKSPAI
ncbi:MAG: HAD-IIIA family hydrolase [Nitrospirae bacterium]|nr:HAD-IIIA family hydrolase [Nitrospirota bacterium]MBI3359372.1 HAD-IIIA family hydrolase [Candidatus Troglogloeales bacterium]MBI3598835.1 HAD-IIIA family hydrolase [Candidatus Troglogloeales bacterium]